MDFLWNAKENNSLLSINFLYFDLLEIPTYTILKPLLMIYNLMKFSYYT